jgi:hypothetical protein
VAGCGTTQAAHYSLRWPNAQVIGIDLSEKSIRFTQGLKRKYGLANLEYAGSPWSGCRVASHNSVTGCLSENVTRRGARDRFSVRSKAVSPSRLLLVAPLCAVWV